MKHVLLLLAALLLASCASRAAQLPPVGEQAGFSVVTLNLWHDQRDWPTRQQAIVAALREMDPDVIALQEVLQHETLPNQAESLAEALGREFVFSSVDAPDAAKRYGNAILSKHPIIATNWRALAPADDYRTALHAVLDVDGALIDVYCTHLHHTGEGGAIRAEQVADLLDFIDSTRQGQQAILLGDFNAAPDCPELAPVHERFEDTFARFVDDPLSPAHTTLNTNVGHTARRIDHVFLGWSADPVLAPVSSEIILDEPMADGNWPSDHFGVATRFAVAE